MAVLITRPDERGKTLVDQLNQAGVVALHLPLLSIEAGAELAQLPTKLNQLKSGDYVFLVSKSAVENAEALGVTIAEQLLAQGADKILAKIYSA